MILDISASTRQLMEQQLKVNLAGKAVLPSPRHFSSWSNTILSCLPERPP